MLTDVAPFSFCQRTRLRLESRKTCLAPTILEIAGLPGADWMRRGSTGPRLKPQPGDSPKTESRGLAFNEFPETSNVFFHVRSGSAGVTGGAHQYVLDMGTCEATLRNIAERLVWSIDRLVKEPEVARELRDALYSRFRNLKVVALLH